MSSTEPEVPPIPLPPAAPIAPPSSVPPVEPTPPATPGVDPGVEPGAAPGGVPPAVPGYPAPGYGAPGYPAPGYVPPGGYAALPPVLPKGLSFASIILGIGSIAFSFAFLGVPAGIAAVITGHLAQRRQPHARGLWITGLITGYIGIALGLVLGIFIVLGVVSAINDPSVSGY